MNPIVRRGPVAATAISIAVAAALVTGSAAPATAAPQHKLHKATGKNGVCEVGELCLFYTQNFGTPVLDLYNSDSDFSNDNFPGTQIRANNNTESFWNRDTYTWRIYTGTNATGSIGCIRPGASGNLNNTFRNLVSSAFYSTTPCNF